MVRSSARLQKKGVSEILEKKISTKEIPKFKRKVYVKVDKIIGGKSSSSRENIDFAVKKEIDCDNSKLRKSNVIQEIVEQNQSILNSCEVGFVSVEEGNKIKFKMKEEGTHFENRESSAEFSKNQNIIEGKLLRSRNDKILADINQNSDDDDPDDPDDPAYTSSDDIEAEEDDLKNRCEDMSCPAKKKSKNSLFSCFHCDYTCNTKSQFAIHLRTHKGQNTVKCDLCGDVFLKPQSLENHMRVKHPASVKDKSRKYSCKLCDRKYSSKYYLTEHLQSVHAKNTPYACSKCDKKFARKGGLLQHMVFHQGTRPFSCTLCSATFKYKANEETHMRHHFRVKAFECEVCAKGFFRKDQMKKHVLTVHKKESIYKCSICNKSFKGHILTHLRTHLKEKQFKCKLCDKAFVQSSQLTVHMRTHTGSKPYQCKTCKTSFAHSSALRVHELIHTGERPVKCPLCPADFKQVPHMKKHMRCVHNCNKPYMCVPCSEFFQTKAELQNHTANKKCNYTPKT